MDNSLVEEGPWRATRLWNSIVKSLHEGIPRKKHRKHLRTYEECFTANEALEWLHRQLKRNPNFGSDVSKEQTLLLLQKLSKAGVIVRLDDEVSASNSSIKTPSAMLCSNDDTFKAGGDLYRLAPKADSVLHTPGKKAKRKSEEIRSPLGDLGNKTPLGRDDEFEEKPKRLQGIRSSFRKIKNKHRDLLLKDFVTVEDEDCEEDVKPDGDVSKDRENLNLSYLQSLPANSLVVLGNDRMWREVFNNQLRLRLSDAHINSLEGLINVNYIIHNMTKVSEKGVVQLSKSLKMNDLPRWTLSAMKCLANWPRPFQGTHGSMPYYQGFEVDVFNVVKDYFTSLTCPLITFDLFDIFVSAFIEAEAVSAQRAKPRNGDSYHFAVAPMPYLESTTTSPVDFSSKSSSPSSGYFSDRNYGQVQQRYANIRPTLNILPRQTSSPIGMSYLSKDMSSPTAIMRNFLPPNTCFETAFMDENPVTRIVPQRGNEILHHLQARPASRMSIVTAPLSSATSLRSSVWDSRSIATQTSDEEEKTATAARKPKWKRSSRQRKSIAVMETNQETMDLTRRFRSSSCSTMRSTSVENMLDSKDQRFLQKYNQLDQHRQQQQQQPQTTRRYSMASLPTTSSLADKKMSSSPPDNMILSKTVRKEKRKQRERRSLDARTMLETPISASSLTSCHQMGGNAYQHLSIVKTPMHICGQNAPIPHMDEGMQRARAEPFNQDPLNVEGQKAAIEAFQLLGLLLPPEQRRKLQLLLKFMKRVGSKEGLQLSPRNPTKSCHDVVVETFAETILRPKNDLANYDEEVCRKIICFFLDHFEEIWSPSVGLRKEVEERVYQSLVNKRIEDGLDPYPVTFCTRVPSKVYEKEKVSGVQAAMLDLLEHTLNDKKMSQREKRKKLKKFKAAYPDIFVKRFPTPQDEPDLLKSMSSLTRFKSVMRI